MEGVVEKAEDEPKSNEALSGVPCGVKLSHKAAYFVHVSCNTDATFDHATKHALEVFQKHTVIYNERF